MIPSQKSFRVVNSKWYGIDNCVGLPIPVGITTPSVCIATPTAIVYIPVTSNPDTTSVGKATSWEAPTGCSREQYSMEGQQDRYRTKARKRLGKKEISNQCYFLVEISLVAAKLHLNRRQLSFFQRSDENCR